VEHAIVKAEPGTFVAWPANNGLWNFGNGEILVGYSLGAYVEKKGHNGAEPFRHALSRSLDGGRTWTDEQPSPFVDERHSEESSQPVDFSRPDLALRLVGNGYPANSDIHHPRGGFLVSEDRGRTWSGVRSLGTLPDHPEFAGRHFSTRTNYLIDGDACLLFVTTRVQSDDKAVLWGTEKIACVRTKDGLDFEFLGWVVPPSDPYRATMPAVARIDTDTLFVAARRRQLPADASSGANADPCWIDGYISRDGGRSWTFTGRVAETGRWNGNPPALALTGDGRLCCVYGNRDRATMEAVFSADDGSSWSQPTVLRNDYHRDSFGDPDLGYPRLTLADDGSLVATYYWATESHPHHHIAATRWRP
jgi:hypothetical protein